MASAQAVRPWSRGAIADAQKWALGIEDLSELLRAAVTSGKYLKSEWCESKPDGPWAACDVYVVARREWIAAPGKKMTIHWYLKVAISITGAVLLTASNHPQGA